MQVEIDEQLCIACGFCWDLCPEVFEQGPDKASRVRLHDCTAHADCCREAADRCPQGAIIVHESPA